MRYIDYIVIEGWKQEPKKDGKDFGFMGSTISLAKYEYKREVEMGELIKR